jgi:hypothetical protein
MESNDLPFSKALSYVGNRAATIAQSVRIHEKYDRQWFLETIWDMSLSEFKSFCYQIMQWQHFAYQLKETVGTVSLEYVPPEQKNLFKKHVFDETSEVRLIEDGNNSKDPGIIVQQCIHSYNANEKFRSIIKAMSQDDFKEFCLEIERLCYFRATQDGCYFSHRPDLISRDNEHFWFND